MPPVQGADTCQLVPFGIGEVDHHRITLKRMNRSQRIVNIAGFIVRTRLTRIPIARRTLSTIRVSSVLDSLPELGNL